MEKVTRTRKVTVARVVSNRGEPLGEIVRDGTVQLARMANAARREWHDPTVTVCDVRTVTEKFEMPSAKFFALADKVN